MQREDSKAERQPLFDRLLKGIRFALMSGSFLSAIAFDPGVKNSGLLPAIMRRAIWQRGEPDRERYPTKWPSSRAKEADSESYSCTFTTHFTKTAIEALQKPRDGAHAPLGLLHGFPCHLTLKWEKERRIRLLLYFVFLKPDATLDTPGEADWEGQDKDDWRGFEFTVFRALSGRPRSIPIRFTRLFWWVWPIPSSSVPKLHWCTTRRASSRWSWS